MKIVVMSDSHAIDKRVDQVLEQNKDADYFIHLGDLCSNMNKYPDIIFVRGNNDYDDVPLERICHFNGIGMLLTHSHKYYFDRLNNMAYKAKQTGCQIVLYGHTHQIADDEINGIRLLNPGSLLYNRDGSAISYLIITINENSDFHVEKIVL